MHSTIYTKTGDTGTTSLFGGTRVGKDSLRVWAYGTLDELNASLGVCTSYLAIQGKKDGISLFDDCLTIERTLFSLGTLIAHGKSDSVNVLSRTISISSSDTLFLEERIDAMTELLPPLTSFILPTGSVLCSHFHICRTIARRAERLLVSLNAEEYVPPEALAYINRLSDYFFTCARFCLWSEGIKEIEWK